MCVICKKIKIFKYKIILIKDDKYYSLDLKYFKHINHYVFYIGIDNIKIDLAEKKVSVTTALDSDEILETIKKTGKTCQFLRTQKWGSICDYGAANISGIYCNRNIFCYIFSIKKNYTLMIHWYVYKSTKIV